MNKNFTIKDLRTGHIVVTKGKGNGIVIGNRIKSSRMLFENRGLSGLRDYNENFEQEEFCVKEYNIEEVYEIIDAYDCGLDEIIDELPRGKVKLIWKRKREIDWNKVPKFTRVQVRDKCSKGWENRRFIEYREENMLQYITTPCDEFTFTETSIMGWEQIRIYDESEIKDEWYK